MYIFGSYQVIQQQDPTTGSMVNVFDPDARAEYEPSLPVMLSRLTAMAKDHSDLFAPEDESEREAHVNAWASHAKTLMINRDNNHQQIAAPSGHIYWWLKLV